MHPPHLGSKNPLTPGESIPLISMIEAGNVCVRRGGEEAEGVLGGEPTEDVAWRVGKKARRRRGVKGGTVKPCL